MALPCKITFRFPKDIDQITEEGILWQKAGTTATANTVGIEAILNHLPLSRQCGSMSLLWLVTSSFLMVQDNFVHYLVQSEAIFQTMPE